MYALHERYISGRPWPTGKRTWLDISRHNLSCYEYDPSDFIERVVTQDEKWVHHFDPKSKMEAPWLTSS